MPDEARSLRPVLPATRAELLASRKSSHTAKSINDWFEEIHYILWEQEDYRKWFEPIWREEAIESSFIMDDSQIVSQVRKYAIDHELPISENSLRLGVLIHSLNVLRNRYPNLNRKKRQEQMGGLSVTKRGRGRPRNTTHFNNNGLAEDTIE